MDHEGGRRFLQVSEPLLSFLTFCSLQENQSSVRRLHPVIAPQTNCYTHSYLFFVFPLDLIDMQYKKTLVAATLVVSALSAYAPPEPWSTLTPPGTYPGGITNYPSTFGIAVRPMQTSVAKRDVVSQIRDGQIQAPVATEARQTTEVRPATEAKPTTEAARPAVLRLSQLLKPHVQPLRPHVLPRRPFQESLRFHTPPKDQ